MTISVCEMCGKPIALVNVDKIMGRVGLTRGWVHVTRRGRPRLRVRHKPLPPPSVRYL